MAFIALLTDFGTENWFASELKAVIYGIAPESTVIDISHQIKPGDIRTAAFTLLACFKSFPLRTIFCTVVDPDTGSNCKPVIFKSVNFFFTGPDNGVLSWICNKENIEAVYKLNSDNKYIKTPPCPTFYGRDLIAPAAAHLSNGISPEMIGSRVTGYNRLPFPDISINKNMISGQIIFIDSFGNAITNINSDLIDTKEQKELIVNVPGKISDLPVKTYYKEVPQNSGLAYKGSAGFVEIGVNKGSAAQNFNLTIGNFVEIIETV